MKWHHFRISSQLLKDVCDSVCHRIIRVKSCTDTTFARKDFFKTAALIDTGYKFIYHLVRRVSGTQAKKNSQTQQPRPSNCLSMQLPY